MTIWGRGIYVQIKKKSFLIRPLHTPESRGLITEGIHSLREPQVKLSAQEWEERFL